MGCWRTKRYSTDVGANTIIVVDAVFVCFSRPFEGENGAPRLLSSGQERFDTQIWYYLD